MKFQELRRWAIAIALVLLVPIVPFIGLGDAFEAQVQAWLESASPLATGGLIIAVLASDIFLPIPSSFVSTLGGSRLGLFCGTAVSWLGMTAGAAIGFALAKTFGRAIAVRLSNTADLARMDALTARRGPAIIVITRALPVLAEAAVLLLGTLGLSWRQFLPSMLLANLGLALAYAALGHYAQQNDQLLVALAASIALPVLAAASARLFWKVRNNEDGAKVHNRRDSR
jgi:uncharacterized membrane protein YdjX (TVP38/TMEM64 family)